MLGFHLRYSISYKFYEAAMISNLVKAMLTFSSFHPGPRRPHARARPRARSRPHPRRRLRRRPLARSSPRSSPRPHPRCRRCRRQHPFARASPHSRPRPRPRTPFLHLLPTSLLAHLVLVVIHPHLHLMSLLH